VPAYQLEPGDKTTNVTIYLAQGVVVGELVTRQVVRVSTWLRTPGLPDYGSLFDVTYTRGVGAGDAQVVELSELHVPVAQMIALHLTPPGHEPVEFDPNELNRKMEPITAIAGPFHLNGSLRMPGHLTVAKQMGLMREPFVMLNDVSIASALEPSKVVQVSTILLRPSAFTFAPGKAR
jgi:hypothetical protein